MSAAAPGPRYKRAYVTRSPKYPLGLAILAAIIALVVAYGVVAFRDGQRAQAS